MLYVLEGKTGMPRSDGEFPLSMDSIRARMAIHDVDGNGNLDIIANDNKGNLAVFNHLVCLPACFQLRKSIHLEISFPGKAIVEHSVSSHIQCGSYSLLAHATKSQGVKPMNVCADMYISPFIKGPSLGDINGDGQVDIVLATEAGHIFAWFQMIPQSF